MNKLGLISQFGFFVCLGFNSIRAQCTIYDTDLKVMSTLAVYTDQMNPVPILYSGQEYVGFDRQIAGNAFFITDSLQKASIYFNGQWFGGISAAYEIARDELVISNSEKTGLLIPDQSAIKHFFLLNHYFTKINVDSISDFPGTSGFYDEAYCSGTLFLIKRMKKIEESKEEFGITAKFSEMDKNIIKKGDRYYQVSSEASLLKLFPDKKKELKKYLRRIRTGSSIDLETEIGILLRYYDQLTEKR